MIVDVWVGRQDVLDRVILVEKVRHEDFNDDAWICRAHRFDGLPEMFSTAVIKVIAGHGRDDNVLEVHTARGFGDALRFVEFKRQGFGGAHGTETARPGATIAGDHERGGALAPALPMVRAL